MADLLDRRVHDEHAAAEEHQHREVERTLHHSRPVQVEEGIGEGLDEVHHQEQQDDAKADGDEDRVAAHRRLVFGGRALGLDGDVQQVVEAEHGLEEQEDAQVGEVLDGEQFGHGGLVEVSGAHGPARHEGAGSVRRRLARRCARVNARRRARL